MKNHDYEYNYHELANDADFFDDDSWIDEDEFCGEYDNLPEDIDEE